MIDNKEHNVLLVDALVLEVGFFSVLVISVRIADQGRGSVLFMTIRIQLSGCWWNESWLMSLYSVLSTFLYPSKPPAAPPNLRSRASVAQRSANTRTKRGQRTSVSCARRYLRALVAGSHRLDRETPVTANGATDRMNHATLHSRLPGSRGRRLVAVGSLPSTPVVNIKSLGEILKPVRLRASAPDADIRCCFCVPGWEAIGRKAFKIREEKASLTIGILYYSVGRCI